MCLVPILSASNWLKPPAPKGDKKNEKYRYFSKRYIMNNPRKLIFMLIFFLINIGLSAISIWRYWDSNAAVIIARICGMCLNFNSAFIIVLMLRRLLTWLRSTRAAHILPLDQSIMLHKMVGIVIFIQSMVHTIAHVVNIGKAYHISFMAILMVSLMVFRNNGHTSLTVMTLYFIW